VLPDAEVGAIVEVSLGVRFRVERVDARLVFVAPLPPQVIGSPLAFRLAN
jgi:hypothetical protein